MKPEQLSRELRQGTGEYLRNRRRIVALALVSSASMGLISLYQMGIVKHLPDPPLPGFNSDKVDAAGQAYSYFATPDALLGLTSYGVTAVLAAMGGTDRAKEQPLIPLALAGKVAVDVLAAAKLTVDQIVKHRALCVWCLIAAGCSFASVPWVIAEARAAWGNLNP